MYASISFSSTGSAFHLISDLFWSEGEIKLLSQKEGATMRKRRFVHCNNENTGSPIPSDQSAAPGDMSQSSGQQQQAGDQPAADGATPAQQQRS